MLRNQLFIDFDQKLDRSLFDEKILKIYDLIVHFINTKSKYKDEFWKSIWLKVISENEKIHSMLLILINPDYPYQVELNELSKQLNLTSFYYQFRRNKRKPDKSEDIFLYQGKLRIYEIISTFKFNLSPYSFCQANNKISNLLYQKITNLFKNEKYDNLVVYGRTASPISIMNSNYFKNIICSIPCSIVYQNMLLDLKENNIKNVKCKFENKKDFNPNYYLKNYLLFLSTGYQGLPKSILNKIKKLKNKKIYFLYCNKNKLNKDMLYLKNFIKVINQYDLKFNDYSYETIIICEI
jgi:tRNA/tmRNA/rRNA uracil-C5-methylase (TrmA/RlmC/RlmD family)